MASIGSDNPFLRQLDTFISDHQVVDVDELPTIFTDTSEHNNDGVINFPFASDLCPSYVPRLSINKNERVTFMCRASFGVFLGQIDNLPDSIDVVGCGGGGKSHFMAALAIILYCRRRIDPATNSRVVYIPSCLVFVNNGFFNELLDHLAFTFFDDVDLYDDLRKSVKNLKDIADYFNRFNIDLIYVMDDYNYFTGHLPHETRTVLQNLNYLTRNAKTIRAHSSRSATSPQLEPSQTIHITHRLSIDEWRHWRAVLPMFDRLNLERHKTSTMAAEDREALEDKVAELEYLTGRNPLIMRTLCSYKCGDRTGLDAVAEAIRRYWLDSNIPNMGGLFVKTELHSFRDSIPHGDMQLYTKLMAESVAGFPAGDPFTYLYDARFFFLNVDTGVLEPLCGFIAQSLAQELKEHERQLLRCALTPARVASALCSVSSLNARESSPAPRDPKPKTSSGAQPAEQSQASRGPKRKVRRNVCPPTRHLDRSPASKLTLPLAKWKL